MKKALLIWGGWDGHEPKLTINIAAEILKKEGFDITVSDTLNSYHDEKLMAQLDLIVQCWTMGEIKKGQFAALNKAVAGGIGLSGWHGGLCDAFRQNCDYQFMTGGQWVAHPGGAETKYTVNIIRHNDPIVEGLSDFEMVSEQYYMHTDTANEVLATTTFKPQYNSPGVMFEVVMPVIWKRNWGKGKVFYSSLGHVAKDFDVPQVKEILHRGMLWACA